MDQNNNIDKNLLSQIKNVTPKHCDLCGYKYSETDYNIIKQPNQGQIVVHIKCQSCGNAYMLNVFSPSQGLIGSAKSQINLDLSNTHELVKFAGKGVITVNEALDAYNSITKEDGLEKFIKKNESLTSLGRVRRSNNITPGNLKAK